MAVITDINLQKSKTRANIFIDHKFCCGLDLSTVVKNGLKKGMNISEERLLEIQKESEMSDATEKALSLLERQKYTKSRLKAKLKEKGYLEELVDEVINKLSEYGYVNNLDYIKSFVVSNPNKSKKEIEKNLILKGVTKEELNAFYEELDEPIDEQEKCDRVAEKYMRNKEKNSATAKKLMSHLLYKGFSFSNARISVEKFTSSEIDDYD